MIPEEYLAAPPASADGVMDWTDRELLDWYVQQYTHVGWRLSGSTGFGVQLVKPRQWSIALALPCVLLPILGGCLWWPLFLVAALGVLIVLVDYLRRRDQYAELTVMQARTYARRAWSRQASL